MDKRIRRILAVREGGGVKRCHTFPHIGEYSVGSHSYGALCLLLILHPNPSLNLVKAVLWHDCGERWVGDIPAPAKWADRELRNSSEALEIQALEHYEILPVGYNNLSLEELQWLKAVDTIDLFLWCHEQEMLGNRWATYMRERIQENMRKQYSKVPKPCQDVLENYQLTRLPEEFR